MRGGFYKSLRMKPKSKHLNKEQLDYIAQHYPNESNAEIAEALGLSKWTIKSRAEKHGWRKSKEFIVRQCREVAIRGGYGKRINTPESYAKREATLKKQYDIDKMRIRWGMLPAQKGRHYTSEPRARLFQRNRLERLGYIVDKENLIAYYTPETKRAPRIEKVPRGQKIGSIRGWYDFAPLESK